MSDFESKVAEAVSNKLTDGTVEMLIEKKLEECVNKALDGIFSYHGDGKRLIESKLSEVMIPVIEQHDFNKYLVKLDGLLTSIVNQTSIQDNKKILDNFKELMIEPQMKEIKLSEIFKKYCEHVAKNVDTSDLAAFHEYDQSYYENVTAKVDVEYIRSSWRTSKFEGCYVHFTCEQDSKLDCQLKLYKGEDEDKWRILRGVGSSVEINSLRYLSSFEVFLSVIMRSYADIILDVECEYNDDIEPEEKPE